MSGISSEIPGFGSAAIAPRQNPTFSPGADFTTEDYYVFSRCDGHASARDVVVMVGLGTEKGFAILGKLRRLGALLLPGETPEVVAARRAAEAQVADPAAPRRSSSDSGSHRRGAGVAPLTVKDPMREASRDLERVVDLGELSTTEAMAMAETVDLSDGERRRIIQMVRLDARGALFDLLGVLPTVDKKDLKRSYFRLSKEFHPDRYYKRELGSFRPWLTLVFESVTRAFETLSDDRSRGAYEARLRGEEAQVVQPGMQSRGEHAAELFARACAKENQGSIGEAVTLFGAALRVDAQPRYLSRAARCCLAAGELALAEEYARKGAELRPSDPAQARVLADVLRAAGKLPEAEATLLAALELRSENEVLAGELRADLAAVRGARRDPSG